MNHAEIWLIVICSALGVIARSLNNESQHPAPSGYKMLWGMEDVIVLTHKVSVILETVLEEAQPEKQLANISRALSLAHQANDIIKAARQGEYDRATRL